MSKDLIDDQYGRFYEFPKKLAGLGNKVVGLCLSYRVRKEGLLLDSKLDGTLVDWYSVNLGRFVIPGLIRYFKRLDSICREFRPDIIYVCSDALHAIHGPIMAKRHKIPWVIDLYDNFESYTLTRIPGILLLFRHAVSNAPYVVCVSKALKSYVEEQYYPKGKVMILPNAIPVNHFQPMDGRQCRKNLGLPLNAKLIGTAGALGPSRGTGLLFEAAIDMIAEDPNIHLVVAGTLEHGTIVPQSANIHFLGRLEYEQMPIFFNALDVGVICNRESSFGSYCFPQKAYEMLACGISVIAADVGTMSEMFINSQECLYEPEMQQSLIATALGQLACSTFHRIDIMTWDDLGENLENIFTEIVKTYNYSYL